MKDILWPDGPLWRCEREGCEFTTDDDGPDYCPGCGSPLMRVLRRITFGDPPESRDVVVQTRGLPWDDPDA